MEITTRGKFKWEVTTRGKGPSKRSVLSRSQPAFPEPALGR
jgi:hypothetical protein